MNDHRKIAQSASRTLLAALLAMAAAPTEVRAHTNDRPGLHGALHLPEIDTTHAWHAQLIRPTRTTIDVSLTPINADGVLGSAIVVKPTWIIIHGRSCSAADFRNLGAAIAAARPDEQVLLLDWSAGAADNGPFGLAGALWTPVVAAWANATLRSMGFSGQQISLIGHSWGTYIAYDMAADWKSNSADGGRAQHGVRALVALDPASGGAGIDLSAINFAAVAQHSWAFWDGDMFGSRTLALTAHEAFCVNCAGANVFQQHWACVDLFARIIRNPAAACFSLDRLTAHEAGPWDETTLDDSAPTAQFCSTLDVVQSHAGQWDLVRDITYLASGLQKKMAFSDPAMESIAA